VGPSASVSAARHPATIGRLVILNTAAFASPRIPLRISLCKLPVVGPLLVRAFNGFAWPATWMSVHRRPLTPTERRGFLLPYDSWAHRVAVSAFVQDIPLAASHRSWPALAAVEAGLAGFRNRPALIMWGGRDFCFNDSFLERWRKVLPEAEVHRFDDAGHYVLEDAREEVIARAVSFLTAR
jgi:haloalkane dehalogenase